MDWKMGGALAFGLVIGWYVYYVNRYRKGDVQISDITSLIGAIGGGAILALFPSGSDLFGTYGVGLAIGFFLYFFVLILLVSRSSNFDSDWFLDGRRKNPVPPYGYPPDHQGGTPMAPASSGIVPSQTFYVGGAPTAPVAAGTQPRPGAALAPAAAPGAPDEDDPANPVGAGEMSEIADFETARLSTNGILAATDEEAPAAAAPAAPGAPAAPAAPFTIPITIADAQQFLQACINAHPRVTYGLGAKVPFHGAVPGKDFKKVDCSGFVREAIWRATNPHVNFPDGSVVQHDWVERMGFQHASVADGKLTDNHVRIAFLSPNATTSHIGHVVLLSGGRTLESHGGVGPDSRPWTGQGWQAKTSVYVLT